MMGHVLTNDLMQIFIMIDVELIIIIIENFN